MRQIDATGAILHVTGADGRLVLRRALEGRRWTVGCGEAAAIRLDGEAVAEQHVELRLCPFRRWWVHDLGSNAGTRVNGRRVVSHVLAPGDDVEVAGYRLRVEIPPPPPSESELPPAAEHTTPLVGAADRVSLLPPPGALPLIGVAQIDAITSLEVSLMTTARRRERCDKLARCLVEDLEASAAAVLHLRQDGSVSPLAGPHGALADTLLTSLSGSVLARIWEERDTVVARSSRRSSPTDPATPDATPPRLVLASPLSSKEDSLDLVYVVLESDGANDGWRALLRLITTSFEQVDTVWAMRDQVRVSAFVEHELETARNLQRRLIRLDSGFDDLEVVMGYQPCFDVGGDYVDALRLDSGKVLLVIADVCGKGLQGALVASNLHALVRATVQNGERVPELVERMNRYLCRHLPEHSFVTLVALELDPQSGEIECVNAGHPAPLVASCDGMVRELQGCRNVALGIIDSGYSSERSRLQQDEVLLLYTDGYIDMLDGRRRPLGIDRFGKEVARAVMRHRDEPVKALDAELRRTASAHRAGPFANDDFTFLIVRRRSDEVSRVA